MHSSWTFTRTLAPAFISVAAVASAAHAQLREPEVLVVYDARISDSLLVAEAYAGSAKVPGGVGAVAGAHPNVRVVNLAALSGAGVVPAVPDIDYQTFITRLRTPLRAYLTTSGLTRQVRCIVLTKGLPHRILDISYGAIGDDPVALNSTFLNDTFGNLTYASVDSELTLLWQTLDFDEAGDNGDSRADGMIANPFALKGLPVTSFPNDAITSAPKILTTMPLVGRSGGPALSGFIWKPAPGTTFPYLTPGDFYLVCRLDGPSVQVVRSMISRAQNLVVNTSTAGIVLDTDGQPFDNESGLGVPFDTSGSDYQNAYNLLAMDGRFLPQNINYNFFAGVPSFVVGPNIAYSGGPLVFNRSLVYLGSFGANHSPFTQPISTTYAESFSYVPGAVFNSMESYNGRDFGGRGIHPGVPQEQAADFLASGGTFAAANVWEPFTITVPRTRELIQRFLLSNLTWAEAAYSALPALSWQQIVVGDPLARVTRTSEDINNDGKVTIDDLYAWYASPVDINHSGAADNTDADILLNDIRGYEHATMRIGQR